MKLQGLVPRGRTSIVIGILVSLIGYGMILAGWLMELNQDQRIILIAGGGSLVLFGGELMFRKANG